MRCAPLFAAIASCVGAPLHTGGETASPHDTSAADTADTGAAPEPLPLYPDDRVHSPVTPRVLDAWRAILDAGDPSAQADVFMKIGASSTASSNTLHCFADPADTDLGEHVALDEALSFFRAGDAAGSTPFDRDTEAAISGKTAGWAIDGDPSPVEQEIDAIAPRYAIVHYGTNDMGMGSTYDSAMPGFYQNMTALLDLLEGRGILPVLTGISPRNDSAAADEWAETYNAVLRGMAQARLLPYIDLHLATWELDEHGLSSDGLHLNAYGGGACVLTDDGLGHGYNVRNLIVLEALGRVYDGVVAGDPAPDAADWSLSGDGSPESPLSIDRLPFADTRDTRDSPYALLDVYTGCDYDADESGPEWYYALTLERETAIRALVLDGSGVDVDVHLLGPGGGEGGCLLRSDRTIETTLGAGTWLFALDTYVSGGAEQGGEYLFAVLECEPGDGDCE